MSTDMTQSGQQPIWEVFDIEDTFGPASLSGSNRIKRVHFHVTGVRDSYVDVPAADFTAANVAAMIEEAVSHIIDVRMLKSTAF